MVGCISTSRGSTGPLPHEIKKLELYRRSQSAERTLSGRKAGDSSFTDRECLWLLQPMTCTLSLGEYRRKRKEIQLVK